MVIVYTSLRSVFGVRSSLSLLIVVLPHTSLRSVFGRLILTQPSLYSYSSETTSFLNKFRFQSARATSVQALVYTIDKTSYEIVTNGEILTSLEELAEELPDNSPSFVLLSHPLKTDDGRIRTPFVLLYWIPQTSGSEGKMLYAGALEEFREKAGVAKVLKVEDEEDFEDIEEKL